MSWPSTMPFTGDVKISFTAFLWRNCPSSRAYFHWAHKQTKARLCMWLAGTWMVQNCPASKTSGPRELSGCRHGTATWFLPRCPLPSIRCRICWKRSPTTRSATLERSVCRWLSMAASIARTIGMYSVLTDVQIRRW
ncbi:hypothetical protein SDC9_207516 [bioreactor metagenome]|uniref:Uncharacterized protein n=1 Tax=bioreactor metagenome TaxID=1076179 RepID=A0A645JHH1_9ZZZZ